MERINEFAHFQPRPKLTPFSEETVESIRARAEAAGVDPHALVQNFLNNLEKDKKNTIKQDFLDSDERTEKRRRLTEQDIQAMSTLSPRQIQELYDQISGASKNSNKKKSSGGASLG